MKLPKWPWWAWALIAVFAVALVGAVVSPSQPDSGASERPAARILKTASLPSDLPAYTVLLEPGVASQTLTDKARDLCGAASHCIVTAWTDSASVGRGWPLTDREAAAAVYTYSVNRTTGYEGEVWDCEAFPTAPKDRCAAD